MSQSSPSSRETGHRIIAAIPCFNTEHFIADIVSRAREYVDQVVVIDDGSYDDTAQVARAAGALVVGHEVNKGYGEAIKSCFQAAKANAAGVLVTLDGDGQHDPDSIPQILTPILEGKADLVIGSRFLANEHNMPSYRRFGISVITFLWNFGAKVKVADTQSGFRAYGGEVFRSFSLSEKGMSISIEILEKARKEGTIIKEVPIPCFYVPSTLSLKAIRHGLGVALSVVRIRLKNCLQSLVGR